jgi:DNA invertase Pin-like site-specific DNA recombinase
MAVMEREPDTRPWAVYARLSKVAKTGDLEKCEYQTELCKTYAASRDIPTGNLLEFSDPSLSAWKKRVKRPQWDEMMKLARSGQLAGILVYAVDRFTRRPRDLEDLIDLADEHGLVIEGPRSGRLDLTTATGRQQARWMAMQAASESDNTSERIKTTLGRKMREGKPMGAGRSYGFEVGGTGQRADEVAVLREVARRMLAGEKVAHIAADLNSRGLVTSRGGQWNARNLTRMMARPRNGGHVEHNGRIVGTIPGEPVLDADTYNDLQAQITARRRGRRPTGRYLLTGIARCGKCKRTMNGATNTRTGARIYRCPPQLGGCGRSADAASVEDMTGRYMVKVMSDPANIAAVAERERALTDARAAQLAKVEAVEDQLADLEVKWASGELVQRAYDRAKPVLDRRLAAEQARLDALERPAVPLPADAAADWAEATDAERRILIQRYRVQITVGPHRPGARRFDPARVRITR